MRKLIEAPRRRWRIVPGCPEYEVSNDGRVRAAGTRVWMPVVFSKQGRPRYHLPCCGGYLHVDAHALVARAFVGPAPAGKPWVLHGDDDPLNCVDTNLRWGDRWDNAKDFVANRRRRLGLASPPAFDVKLKGTYRLKPSRVLAIIGERGTHSIVARKFGVSRSTVTKIKRGERHPELFAKHRDGQPTKL